MRGVSNPEVDKTFSHMIVVDRVSDGVSVPQIIYKQLIYKPVTHLNEHDYTFILIQKKIFVDFLIYVILR